MINGAAPYKLIYLLILINIVVILLHDSTDLFVFETINEAICNSKLQNSIYVDVYSETNDIATGRDNRLAIVRPFNWYLLNSRSDVYALSPSNDRGESSCYGDDVNGFLKLKSPLSGHALHNVYRVCLPVTVSAMITHFQNKPRARIYYGSKRDRIDVIDVVDFLLAKGAFTNYVNETAK